MKPFRWDAAKSDWLKLVRGHSFEELAQARIVKIRQNPTKSHQQIMLAEVNGYIWVIPFEEEQETWFLRTAYPSRKYTREYRHGQL